MWVRILSIFPVFFLAIQGLLVNFQERRLTHILSTWVKSDFLLAPWPRGLSLISDWLLQLIWLLNGFDRGFSWANARRYHVKKTRASIITLNTFLYSFRHKIIAQNVQNFEFMANRSTLFSAMQRKGASLRKLAHTWKLSPLLCIYGKRLLMFICNQL